MSQQVLTILKAHLSVTNKRLRREQELDQAAAMRLPTEIIDLRALSLGFSGHFGRGISTKRCVNSILVVIVLKLDKLALQIKRIPEKSMIKKLSTNRSY